MVSSTGTTCPICAWVASLYALQNSMMLTPCWPSAVPTGGAGVACPARIWSLTTASTFFFAISSLHLLRCKRPGPSRPPAIVVLDLGDLVEPQLHLLVLDDEDLLDLALGQRGRLGARSGGDEPGDTRRVANDVPGVVVV